MYAGARAVESGELSRRRAGQLPRLRAVHGRPDPDLLRVRPEAHPRRWSRPARPSPCSSQTPPWREPDVARGAALARGDLVDAAHRVRRPSPGVLTVVVSAVPEYSAGAGRPARPLADRRGGAAAAVEDDGPAPPGRRRAGPAPSGPSAGPDRRAPTPSGPRAPWGVTYGGVDLVPGAARRGPPHGSWSATPAPSSSPARCRTRSTRTASLTREQAEQALRGRRRRGRLRRAARRLGRRSSTSAAAACPAASASGSCSPARSPSSPRCWCSSSRPRRSTPTPRPGSPSGSPRTAAAGPPWSPRCPRSGCTTPTTSCCSPTAGSPPRAATRSCCADEPRYRDVVAARLRRASPASWRTSQCLTSSPPPPRPGATASQDPPLLPPELDRRSRATADARRPAARRCADGTRCAGSAPSASTPTPAAPSAAGRSPTTRPCCASSAGWSASAAAGSSRWCCSTRVAAVAALAVPRLLGRLVDRVTGSRVRPPGIGQLALVVVAVVVAAGGRSPSPASSPRRCSGRTCSPPRASTSSARILRLPLSRVEGASTGDLVTRVTRDVGTMSRAVQYGVPMAVITLLTVLLSVGRDAAQLGAARGAGAAA